MSLRGKTHVVNNEMSEDNLKNEKIFTFLDCLCLQSHKFKWRRDNQSNNIRYKGTKHKHQV
jgi:hypothetical protein